MPERPAVGRAAVTRRAVTDIVRTAVLGSYGVIGFATPTPWGHVARRLGLAEPGIRVVLDDLRVDVRIRVAYGLPVAEVARQVESAVCYALARDLGREPVGVSIHVDGLVERDGGLPPPADQDAAAPGRDPARDGHEDAVTQAPTGRPGPPADAAGAPTEGAAGTDEAAAPTAEAAPARRAARP